MLNKWLYGEPDLVIDVILNQDYIDGMSNMQNLYEVGRKVEKKEARWLEIDLKTVLKRNTVRTKERNDLLNWTRS